MLQAVKISEQVQLSVTAVKDASDDASTATDVAVVSKPDEGDVTAQLSESSARSVDVVMLVTDKRDGPGHVDVSKGYTGTHISEAVNRRDNASVKSKAPADAPACSDPFTTTKNLVALDVAEVTAWLQSLRLDKAFGAEFAEQLIDGECLAAAEDDDLNRSGKWISKTFESACEYVYDHALRLS